MSRTDDTVCTRHWREYMLSELCDITRGASPRPIHDWISSQGIPWIKISDASSTKSRTISQTREQIRPDGRTKSVSVFPGDLILSNSATPGIPKFVGINACIHDGWLLLRNLRNIDRLFCYYLLVSEKPRVVRQGTGSVFTNLKTEILKNHRVHIPPLQEQHAIAHILGTLDDKIELNRRMNETLEALARTIFKDWFVDFGPTRAKAEGRAPYLAPELWELFPDALDGEGKPVGWEEQPFVAFLDIVGGGTPKTKVAEFWGGGIPWFSVVDTPPNGGVFVRSTEKTISEKGLAESSARLIPAGTTIITARGTVGNIAIAARDMTFNQSCYALRAQAPVGDYFVYLATERMVQRLQALAHGSVFSTITRATFESLTFLWVEEQLFEQFEEFLEPIFSKIKANGEENEILAKIRDLLLPKLMSGEIRLGNAEKTLEAVA